MNNAIGREIYANSDKSALIRNHMSAYSGCVNVIVNTNNHFEASVRVEGFFDSWKGIIHNLNLPKYFKEFVHRNDVKAMRAYFECFTRNTLERFLIVQATKIEVGRTISNDSDPIIELLAAIETGPGLVPRLEVVDLKMGLDNQPDMRVFSIDVVELLFNPRALSTDTFSVTNGARNCSLSEAKRLFDANGLGGVMEYLHPLEEVVLEVEPLQENA